MDRFASFLLPIWREVGLHLTLADSLERLCPLISGRIPLSSLVIRQVESELGQVVTLAAAHLPGSAPAHPPGSTPISKRDADDLAAWARLHRVEISPQARARSRPPGLWPRESPADLLLAPLADVPPHPACMILVARAGSPFENTHRELLQALIEPLSVALANDQRIREINALREAAEADRSSLLERLGRREITDNIVGLETTLRDIFKQVDLVAPSSTPVLILGETGSGKEVVARAIHSQSPRSAGPFLRVNCGAIAPELIDSELFGHEKGAFTGAIAERRGWFERADGGTLFLDECGELPPAAQVRLLRVLQDGSFERVGGERPLHVDVRIIAATHRNLHVMVAEGSFREDLWYRLAVFPISLPPLRERLTDIPALALHFANRAAHRLGLHACTPTADDLRLLLDYPWPGNVRELAAVMERAAILGNGAHLEIARALGVQPDSPRTLPMQFATTPPPVRSSSPAWETLDQAMRRHVESTLIQTEGRIEGPRGAARRLGINPHTLRARMRKLGIDWARFRPQDPDPVPEPGPQHPASTPAPTPAHPSVPPRSSP